jgi:hypothetical protein
MKLKVLRVCILVLPLLAINATAGSFNPGSLNLGSVAPFAVLGGSTVTNTGKTVVVGDVGVSPGSSITGFPPGRIIDGGKHSNDPLAMQAQADALSAYNVLAGLTPTANLTGHGLAGLTLKPGVYKFDTSAELALGRTLTLDFEGMDDQNIVFQIGTTLTTGYASQVIEVNRGHNDNTYWQVGTSATLGIDTSFRGNIIAQQSITLTTGASIRCRAIALVGAVTMDANQITGKVCED